MQAIMSFLYMRYFLSLVRLSRTCLGSGRQLASGRLESNFPLLVQSNELVQ
jgi:hypothetical protein